MAYFASIIFLVFVLIFSSCRAQVKFDKNYKQTWGEDHLTVTDGGNGVSLMLNEQHGGAGFISLSDFGSGFFEIEMKIPNKNTNGVITSFYLQEVAFGKPVEGVNHFEFDIEFYGRNFSTNVFAKDQGHREQLFHLWFDPTAGFHKYQILWNQHQIAWFVDGEAVRIWKNLQHRGVAFPSQPLHVEASIWNATFAGGNVDWSQAPFTAFYKDFAMNACVYQGSNPKECYSEKYYWNQKQYWTLTPAQQAQLTNHRKNHMYFDYCSDSSKAGPECKFNQ
ncbi:OLC1v1016398C2 [Oldenlandia corymbosa var. corymbosa]|nr:OLC1v1016398C2 [Oldenlandia corymbosa var. corymbosa]